MPRRARYEPLNTFLNSRLVGQLRREPSGAISFQYDQSWIEWTQAIPVSLSLPIRELEYTGAPVIAVFENLLPDNLSLRRRIAARARAEGTDAYSLLGAIGHDCVGALQFLPLESEPGPAGAVDGVPIDAREITEILNNLASAPLGITEDESFRISIAGAQEKTALLFSERTMVQTVWHYGYDAHPKTVDRTTSERNRSHSQRRERISLPENPSSIRSPGSECGNDNLRR
jgi:serine/threonine-protein kinase HipA